MNVQLIEASEENIPEIQKLASRIWNDHYPEIIGQQQVDYMLGKGYSENSLKEQFREGHQFYLIKHENQHCGFISVQPKDYGLFINKFYVDTSLQSKGTGSAAFIALQAKHPLVKQWKLQVNRQNYKAINFYFKMGFVIELVADFDIGDGYFMNDFVMQKTTR